MNSGNTNIQGVQPPSKKPRTLMIAIMVAGVGVLMYVAYLVFQPEDLRSELSQLEKEVGKLSGNTSLPTPYCTPPGMSGSGPFSWKPGLPTPTQGDPIKYSNLIYWVHTTLGEEIV